MDDNLYPASSAFLIQEPKERKQARKEEEDQIQAEVPKIEAVIEHFDKRIAARDSLKAISVDISENPELHQKTCAVNELLVVALREEKELLEGLLADLQK